jgi:8-oxo-dGTP pyrophosphatase MutT (NUDIX family)
MTDVPVRDAATVVLLRDGADGIEAWMLTRVTDMAFAGGMSVFPGGRVDDADALLPLTGGDLPGLAERFQCDVPTAHRLVAAAVRETFEETGVLLSEPFADLSAARADVELGRSSFGELLVQHGLALDAGALHPWSRWVTPAGENRRYDTRFFVGAVPDTAEAQNVTSESSEASWVGVGAAIHQAERGERKLLPPTMMTLASLLPFGSVADVIRSSASRDLEPVRPTLRRDGDSLAIELPDGTVLPLPPGLFK